MGNLCVSNKKQRSKKLHQLFDLYDIDGGFILEKKELAMLAKFLREKKIDELNNEIVALTVELGKLDDISSEQYLNKLLKNKKKISYKNFKEIMVGVKNSEIDQLLTDAKIMECNRLQEELNIV